MSGTSNSPSLSNSSYPDEMAWVEQLRNRDARACEQFVHVFSKRMYACAKRLLPNGEDCAEAVQEAFLAAFRSLHSFAGNSQLGTWLHRIVINTCLMRLRKQKKRNTVSVESLLPTFDETGHHAGPVTAWENRPESALMKNELRMQVRLCIDQLPEDYRSVLILRDIEGLNTDETATTLSLAPGAVKTRLHRARQALRTLMEPYVLGM